MAVGDVYRLIVDQGFLGSDVKNVFWYKQSGVGTDPLPSSMLIDQFATDVWGTALDFMNDGVVTQSYEALNYNSLVDFASLTSDAAGVRTGASLPVFNAWAFRLNRSSTLLRNGRKSYAGVSEIDQDDGQPDAGIQATLDAHADVLSEELISTDGSQWLPVIVERPTTPLPLIPVNIIVASATFVRLSTQNSRKA